MVFACSLILCLLAWSVVATETVKQSPIPTAISASTKQAVSHPKVVESASKNVHYQSHSPLIKPSTTLISQSDEIQNQAKKGGHHHHKPPRHSAVPVTVNVAQVVTHKVNAMTSTRKLPSAETTKAAIPDSFVTLTATVTVAATSTSTVTRFPQATQPPPVLPYEKNGQRFLLKSLDYPGACLDVINTNSRQIGLSICNSTVSSQVFARVREEIVLSTGQSVFCPLTLPNTLSCITTNMRVDGSIVTYVNSSPQTTYALEVNRTNVATNVLLRDQAVLNGFSVEYVDIVVQWPLKGNRVPFLVQSLDYPSQCINTKAESKIIATSCITADAVKSNVTLGITGIILPFVWTLQLSSSWSYIGMALASCHGVYPVSGASPVVVDVLSFPEWHCAQFFSTLNDDGTIGVGSQRVQIGADYKTVTVQDYTAAGASGGVNKGFRFQPLYKV